MGSALGILMLIHPHIIQDHRYRRTITGRNIVLWLYVAQSIRIVFGRCYVDAPWTP